MYKPRHRKQRDWKTPAGKGVAVGVAAAGIAGAALATAPVAEAHTFGVWDRVAACESSGNWHINTGNGYYGGLQFTSSTWLAYHGAKYASRADYATRWQQIQVARRVLAGQGPYAWPVCGPRAGLTRASGDATSAPLPAPRTFVRHHARHHRHHRLRIVRIYHVHSGDTLVSIARRFHVDGGWRALYRANRATVHNPNVIRVGQRLRIPA